MTKVLSLPDEALLLPRAFGFHDDFLRDLVATQWTTTATDSGTATVGDAVGGTVVLAPSDGTVADNDEIYLLSCNELFKIAADKPLFAEIRVQFTEANTDDANVAFGFMNAVAANSILDDGAGPKADYSGAVFFKVDGSTVWQCENSVSTTQKTTTTTTTAGGASYQTLRIECRPQNATYVDWVFLVDGVEVAKHKDQAIGSPTEMNLFVGAKNGAANNESIVVDYIMGYQLR